MSVNYIYLLLVLITIVVILVNQSAGVDSDHPIVTTKLGLIQGNRKSAPGYSYEEFLGIRYGQIPRRFRYSYVNNDPWDGILIADKYGPKCTQEEIEVTSEDCLYLNIWRPVMNESLVGLGPLPVLLWVHGSAFQTGSSADNPGDVIAGSGPVIVATINYRLGAFGFAFGDTHEIQGNQGVSDVITALLWTRDNIGYFGGDPKRVTLGGHSAGSMMGSIFPVLPSIDHSLYSRLFLMSGVSATPFLIENTTVAAAKTKLLAEKVGCGPVPNGPLNSRVIECLQTVNATIIQEKNQDNDIKVIGGDELCNFIPVYGTPFLPQPLIDLFWSNFNKTDHRTTIINAVNKDETATFWGDLRPKTREEGWTMVWERLSYIKKDLTHAEMKPFYDYYFKDTVDGDEKSLRTALTNFMDDYAFRCTSLALSEVYSNRHSVHFAEFDYIIDKYGPEARPDGPQHNDGVEMYFGEPLRTVDPMSTNFNNGNYSISDLELSKRLVQSLINFISGDDFNDWPKIQFDPSNPEVKPTIRKVNYQDKDVKYDGQSICVQWSKLLGFDITTKS